MACLPFTWWDMEHFLTHSTGLQNSTPGVRWCSMVYCVDDALFDAAFRPKAMALFCRSHLGARGQVECYLGAAFSVLGPTTTWSCPRPFLNRRRSCARSSKRTPSHPLAFRRRVLAKQSYRRGSLGGLLPPRRLCSS